MSLTPTFLLPLLRATTLERRHKAETGLADGSLTVTLIRQTSSEIRAQVRNGDGIEYGVTLTEHGTFCSCKDALYRSAVCKHQVAVALLVSHQHETTENRIHLMWNDGTVLCGEKTPKRFWIRWTLNALNWSDLVCQTCVYAWTHPATA